MAREVTIDVEARFIDNVSGEAKGASKSFNEVEKNARLAAKEIDNLGKKKAEPKVDANTTQAKTKVSKIDKLLSKLGSKKTDAKLGILDKATAVIEKVTSKVKSFGSKTYTGLVKLRDSNVLSTMNKISSGLKNVTSKTWHVAVKIKDYATAPLRTIKNMLFSIQSLVMAIGAGIAAKQLIINPINLADAYSSAQIGFSTLLGDSAGQQMMNDLDAFAKATPFKSAEVIAQTQRMIAMGWDAESIIQDMTTIGDAAAATGKGEQGLQQIVTALAQIKTKGKLSTEELNQLAEAGVSAKRYIAEGLGYGSGDEGIAKMTKDLEDGKIASEKALQALLTGMQEYKGMMDKTANETVGGLWSQIEDTFEINVFRKWGQGLQDGAKRGFGSVVTLLNEAEGALEEFGDMLYEVGENVSNWLADKFENAVKRITEITDSYEFKNASLGEKIKMLWNGVVVDPLKEWWEGGGQAKTAETAGKIGSWMGQMLTKGLLAIFGATDVLNEGLGTEAGSNIAGSFVQGFLDNFDGAAITQAFTDAIGNVWGALPTWAKIALGIYAGGKVAGGIANFAGGIASFLGGTAKTIGGFSIASSAYPILTSSGSGIIGTLGKAGVGLGATTTGGAILAGASGIAGGIAGGLSLGKGIYDIYGAYKANKEGNETEFNAKMASGLTTTSGVGMGAAIGAVVGGPLGALIGAGLGGVAGWFMGGKAADDIRAADDALNDITAATEDLETEEEKLAEQSRLIWQNMKDHFGDIKLSTAEIARLVDQIVWGDDMASFEKFNSAVQQAEASLQSMKTASEKADRWMWKASLGVKFNEDEIESIKASFDEYISSAKAYVENKHYEFTAAVSLLVDVESEEGKSIIDSSNAFYTGLQEQLDSLGSQLSENVNIALEDGVITLDEQAEITNLQQQIAAIAEKISNAEAKAEIELIKVKFGSGNLDLDSFDAFMSQMETTLNQRIAANDDAFKASVATLQLELAEGAITEEEYNSQLQTLIDGYTGQVENLKAEILGVELDIIGDAYEDVLGEDAAEKLQSALEKSLTDGIDPINWTPEQARKYLGVDSLSESAAGAIAQMLGGVADQLELVEVDGKLLLDLGIETEGDVTGDVQGKVESSVPDTVSEDVDVTITPQKQVTPIDLLVDEFNIPPEMAEDVIVKLNAAPTFQNQIDILCKDFGIMPWYAENILWQLTGDPEYMNTISPTGADFGIPDSISKAVTINITGVPVYSGASLSGDGSGYRGGVFGGTSAMEQFARGGSTDNGGIVGGSTRYIRVNEEAPEMIIPLSSQRRERAIKLWHKTGELLDVPGFYRGGRSDGGADEWADFKARNIGEVSSGGQTVQIDIGGITFEIHVDGGDPETIAAAIKEQAEELAEIVAGIMNDAFTGQYENTPTRGGAA